MLELALITSLKILFVWGAMKPGMILHWLCRLINMALSYLPVDGYLWIRKPFTECLFCMASVWGLIFTWYYPMTLLQHVEVLLVVAGINYLIQLFINGKESETEGNQEDCKATASVNGEKD